ncbi:MAG: LysM peptidoglycan-binding domain-containing protein [Chloroflexi bacterium]|nr:LysM peptidoglycan-binding domain-containing protein [Chloroflexota bacterium]
MSLPIGRTAATIRTRLFVAALGAIAALWAVPAFAADTRTVAPGESLSQIADELGVSAEALAAANGIADPDRIVAGQVLRVPGAAIAASASTATERFYVVAPGDSLSGIALANGISTQALAAANELSDEDAIIIGTTLVIPASVPPAVAPTRTYTVTAGDSLSGIADLLGVDTDALAAVNDLTDPGLIFEGQVLQLPAGNSNPSGRITSAEARRAVSDAALEFGLDPALLLAIAWQESGWQMQVVSSVGAVGIMQLLPSTALWAIDFLVTGGRSWEYNPVDNARVGAAVFRDLLDQADGDTELAIGAYYQGWGSIHRYGWYDETRQYVANVLALADQFR